LAENVLILPLVHRYDSKRDDLSVPARLTLGESSVEVFAKIDTGATFCLFERQSGEALGLKIEEGDSRWIHTVNGRFQAYGHEVGISVLGIEHSSVVYFYADNGFGRNVLGRRGWLDCVRFGLVVHDCELYLAPYND
jgi:hypothetical protein